MNILDLPAKSNGETIREHTDKLLAAIEELNRKYGSSFEEGLLPAVIKACEIHDYGKAIYVFQKRLGNQKLIDSLIKDIKKIESVYTENGKEKNIPHGYISPAFIKTKSLKEELGEELMRAVITAVYYHHVRPLKIDPYEARNVIENDLKVRYPDLKLSVRYMEHVLSDNIDLDTWVRYAMVVGLLNRADYYASDESSDKLPFEIDFRYNDKDLHDYVGAFFEKNKWDFRTIQSFASDNQGNNIIIVASTGIGKTEAALLWGGDTKLFYTLPLKISINAMYDRIKALYGYPKEKVTLLHSDALYYLMDEETDDDIGDYQSKYEASRRLSYPVTVCTIDQLFTFVYRYRGSEQLLATLKYSKIVIDEIQSYEPKIIAKLIYGLMLVTKAGGKFAIITATMPPVLTHFIAKYKIPHAPQQEFLITDKIRHKVHFEESDDFDYEFISELAKEKKVLIICNTVKRAIEVFMRLKNEYDCEDIKVLHSKFISRHRRMLEEEILEFEKEKGRNGIRVTTQIVEASLDIDFDILFTEMCTADSLLQRMGRCYRKRDYSGNEMPNIYIIDNKNGYGTVYSCKEIYDRSVTYLMDYQDQFFAESDKMKYISNVYNTDDIRDTSYYSEIKKELDKLQNIAPFTITKGEAKQDFRGIDPSYKVVPESVYNHNLERFDECKEIIMRRKPASYEEKIDARRFLEDYSLTISVYYDSRSKECSRSLLGEIDYYTINYEYDFDEEILCGCGLNYNIEDV